MAPHFLHWQQINEAKRRGCKKYDFWGIDEKKWPTLTRFKKSFGGERKEYVGAWDLIFDGKFYTVYKVASLIRK
jgi:lipid II:glycine glycyltransferase (peptidoglycan interpeptide bridge formation enzyme)